MKIEERDWWDLNPRSFRMACGSVPTPPYFNAIFRHSLSFEIIIYFFGWKVTFENCPVLSQNAEMFLAATMPLTSFTSSNCPFVV